MNEASTGSTAAIDRSPSQRRGWDSNPRSLPSTVFKTVPFDRSGTPPGGSVYAARVSGSERGGSDSSASRSARRSFTLASAVGQVGRDEAAGEPLGDLALEGDRRRRREPGAERLADRVPHGRAVPRSTGSTRRPPASRKSRPVSRRPVSPPPPPPRTLVRSGDGATRRSDGTPRTRDARPSTRGTRSGAAGLDRGGGGAVGAVQAPRRCASAPGTVRLRSAPCTARRSLARAVAVARSTGTRRPESRSARSASSASSVIRGARTATRRISRASWRPSKFGVISTASRSAISSALVQRTRTTPSSCRMPRNVRTSSVRATHREGRMQLDRRSVCASGPRADARELVGDALGGAVGAEHVRHLALEVLEDRERHPVDDGGAVQHVHGLGAVLAAEADLEPPRLEVGRVRDRAPSRGSAPGSGTRSRRRTSSPTRSTCRPRAGRRRGTGARGRARAPRCSRAAARARPTRPPAA